MPYAPQRLDWKSIGKAYPKSTPARLWGAMEGNCRLWVGVAWTAFAGLESINTGFLETLNRLPNARVNNPGFPPLCGRFFALGNWRDGLRGSMNRRLDL